MKSTISLMTLDIRNK